MSETESETGKQNQDDLLTLNDSSELAKPKPLLEKPEDKEFNIDDYEGFPMDKWVRYQGTINDNRQKRRVSIANLERYILRYNKSNDDDIPEWSTITLEYYPLTVKAWQKRQTDLASIEDKQRQIGALNLQLGEMQASIRERMNAAGRGDPYANPNSNSSLSKQSIEELQKNVNYLQNLRPTLSSDFQEIKNTADKYAFKVYFHNVEIFDKIRADDLDDVIGACDWKQTNGPNNLRPSKSLPTQSQPGVI